MADGTRRRKQLNFGGSEMALRAAAFLDKAGRSRTKAATIAINQMIDKYGLEDASPKEIRVFLNNFDFINSLSQKGDQHG